MRINTFGAHFFKLSHRVSLGILHEIWLQSEDSFEKPCCRDNLEVAISCCVQQSTDPVRKLHAFHVERYPEYCKVEDHVERLNLLFLGFSISFNSFFSRSYELLSPISMTFGYVKWNDQMLDNFLLKKMYLRRQTIKMYCQSLTIEYTLHTYKKRTKLLSEHPIIALVYLFS